jgi:hypothetical protein
MSTDVDVQLEVLLEKLQYLELWKTAQSDTSVKLGMLKTMHTMQKQLAEMSQQVLGSIE